MKEDAMKKYTNNYNKYIWVLYQAKELNCILKIKF